MKRTQVILGWVVEWNLTRKVVRALLMLLMMADALAKRRKNRWGSRRSRLCLFYYGLSMVIIWLRLDLAGVC